MASFTALAAGRHRVLERLGWNVEEDGLIGAPDIAVVVGAEAHVTIHVSLQMLGLGRNRVFRVDADEQGRMRPDSLRATLAGLRDRPVLVCAQSGNVNTGAFDPLPEIADLAERAGAWLHVDGAFGIWAAVSPRLRHLVAGLERADSWTTDAHKWLNVPYDSGIVFCKHPESHRAAMTIVASYLIQDEGAQRVRDQVDWVPEFSRRARGFTVYAALRSLGRSGLVELVERCCDGATRFAERIAQLDGVEVLNDVVLNQVLFRFESDERTDEVLARVQESGRIWLSGTTWDGRKAIRVSVSNWQTGDEEIDLAVAEFAQAGKSPAR
jgi:glutamate/tyrosine decarboxylase-like PLP-dependent enzyme